MLHKYRTYWHLNENQLDIRHLVCQPPKYCIHIISNNSLTGDQSLQGVCSNRQTDIENPNTCIQAPAAIWKQNSSVRAKDDSSDRRLLSIPLWKISALNFLWMTVVFLSICKYIKKHLRPILINYRNKNYRSGLAVKVVSNLWILNNPK